MKSFKKKMLTLVTTVAVASGLVFAPEASAAPTYDRTPLGSFFKVSQSRLNKARNGQLLGTRFVPSPIPGTLAMQYIFRSTNTFGKPILASSAIVRPFSALPNGHVFVYADFINSLGVKCQPSFGFEAIQKTITHFPDGAGYADELSGRSPIYMSVAAVMAARGVTTILPDHLGLKGAYTANRLGAHITLDAMRAARQIKEAMVRDSRMLIAGYSGGAMVSGFAAAMQPAYAPELNLVGAVMGGSPVDMEWMGQTLGNARNPAFGIVMASMLGLEREYPNRMNVTPRLSKKGKKLANRNRNACITRILDQWANESATTTMNNVQIRKEREAMKVLRENSLINYKRAPKVPVYVWATNKDVFVPHKQVQKVVRNWCKARPGLRAVYLDTKGPDHLSNFGVGLPFALAWIFSRLDGVPAPNNMC
ncbi:MAG TPA: hypothetical protein GX530_03340 [Corynebacteriales bacterium]|nr:hypothetical protein [Mycobacteriales bacterium]